MFRKFLRSLDVFTKVRRYYKKRKKQAEIESSVKAKLYVEKLLEQSCNHAAYSKDAVSFKESATDNTDFAIKALALYLPQFHPFPENDEWWGKGFTEWTNVSKAVPQFVGHYQPHLPGEFGFYDLRVEDVQKRQIELAKHYGIYGFCFHYYWFSGKRLLERPLDQYLNSDEMDFPFCICWANENWTRRWDGQEHAVLMKQKYEEEDRLKFIKDIEPILKDSRYIKVDGKPLLIVYRVTLLPDYKKYVKVWRQYCRDCGIGEIYLVAAQSFEVDNPHDYGFDAAMEFPPHKAQINNINDEVQLCNNSFEGEVKDYRKLAEYFCNKPKHDYTLFKTVSPGWDNDARKPAKGTTFHHSNPEEYKKWLERICEITMKNNTEDERIVFINAWNEWGEGAHLEPDRKYGYANLDVTSKVLEKYKK